MQCDTQNAERHIKTCTLTQPAFKFWSLQTTANLIMVPNS